MLDIILLTHIDCVCVCVHMCENVNSLMVTIAIQQVVLMIFDAPQTIMPFPIDSNVIGPNRGENEFNLTLLLEFIIFFFLEKLRRKLSENPQ